MADFTLARLHEAFEAVRENRGCAGVDGQSISGISKEPSVQLVGLQEELSTGSYLPLPLLKILVAKKNGEPRGLCIPAVRDRVAQKAVLCPHRAGVGKAV